MKNVRYITSGYLSDLSAVENVKISIYWRQNSVEGRFIFTIESFINFLFALAVTCPSEITTLDTFAVQILRRLAARPFSYTQSARPTLELLSLKVKRSSRCRVGA